MRQGLREVGYIEGKNIQLELHSADGDAQRLNALAAELARNKYDIIATIQTAPAVAAKRATSEIPIVLISAGDPLGTGLVTNLARPGGNITGMGGGGAANGKTVEILREILPSLKRAAVLLNTADAAFGKSLFEQVALAARTLSVEVQPLWVAGDADLDGAFSSIAKSRVHDRRAAESPISRGRSCGEAAPSDGGSEQPLRHGVPDDLLTGPRRYNSQSRRVRRPYSQRRKARRAAGAAAD